MDEFKKKTKTYLLVRKDTHEEITHTSLESALDPGQFVGPAELYLMPERRRLMTLNFPIYGFKKRPAGKEPTL